LGHLPRHSHLAMGAHRSKASSADDSSALVRSV